MIGLVMGLCPITDSSSPAWPTTAICPKDSKYYSKDVMTDQYPKESSLLFAYFVRRTHYGFVFDVSVTT